MAKARGTQRSNRSTSKPTAVNKPRRRPVPGVLVQGRARPGPRGDRDGGGCGESRSRARWLRNVYYSRLAENEWFEIGGNGKWLGADSQQGDLAAWKKASGETGSAKKVSFPDSSRSIETYQESLGETATMDAFITNLLAQSKYTWRPEYNAGAVNDWTRAGFMR